MKLYLSSYKLGDHPERFSNLFGENKCVGIIMNATDVFPSDKRSEYLRREITNLAQITLKGQDLDLRKYFGNPTGLSKKIDTLGGVWIMGGNSFTLRRAMKQSGFDKVAVQQILANKLVYGGFSAGAVVAAPSLKGIDINDSPTDIPQGYQNDIVWDGLGLVNFSIAPHYKSDHPESPNVDTLVEYFHANSIDFKTLRDGEAIVISE